MASPNSVKHVVLAPVASAKGGTFPPSKPRKVCKGRGTTHASANSEPLYQDKIQIFVNFLKIY